jgi:hypothetical protein
MEIEQKVPAESFLIIVPGLIQRQPSMFYKNYELKVLP